MTRLLLCAAMICVLGACTDAASDFETGDPFEGAPDLVGGYTLELTDVEGCEGDASGLSWVGTDLTVAGEPSALDFTFDGETIPGTVDPSSAWEFGGALVGDATDLSIAASGVATDNDGTMLLDGTLDVTVSAGGNTCSLSAVLLATRKDE